MGSGLAGAGHRAQVRLNPQAADHICMHHIRDQPGRRLREDPAGDNIILAQQHIAVAVEHFNIGMGLDVDAAVGQGCVGSGHFQGGHTDCPQGQTGRCMIQMRFIEAFLQQILKGPFDPDFLQHEPGCRNIV